MLSKGHLSYLLICETDGLRNSGNVCVGRHMPSILHQMQVRERPRLVQISSLFGFEYLGRPS